MSTGSSVSLGKARHSPPAIAWRVWPIRDEGRRAWLLASLVPVTAIVVQLATGKVYLSLGAAAVTALALWRLWIPMAFELQPKGLVQTTLGRTRITPWKEIRRGETHEEGMVLFTDSRTAPWDALRGLYVPCGPRREEVLVVLAYYLKALTPQDGSTSRHHADP